jgi:monoamine oxidase
MDADVIVVGAGAAGLAAARSLATRSLKVVLVEARERIGGRVWSHQLPHVAPPAEMGAEFIHGPAEHTRALLRADGIADVPTGDESWSCRNDGELRREDHDFNLAARALERARSLVKDESAEQFLRRLEADNTSREAAEAARAFVEGFEAADPSIVSARAIADELRSGADSTSARPLGGYRPLFESLHSACVNAGVQIQLSTNVRRISWRRGTVAVDTSNRAGQLQTIQARAVVVTLPIGVLRYTGDDNQVTFDPEVPTLKREALANLEMGHAVKVALWFRTAFWEEVHDGRYRNGAFFRCEGQPFTAYWTQLPVRSELIVAWAGGPKAMALHTMSHAERIELALKNFGALFRTPALARAEFKGGAMHDWSHDQFARGAYSYVAVGGGNARKIFAEPLEGTVFFAGEATASDGQGGTVNGALETGERAASEAAISLGAGVK